MPLDARHGWDRSRMVTAPEIQASLRTPLRAGASDTQLAELWRAAVRGKRAGHGIDGPAFHQPDRPMSAIGG